MGKVSRRERVGRQGCRIFEGLVVLRKGKMVRLI
jgi:hypothetical protein